MPAAEFIEAACTAQQTFQKLPQLASPPSVVLIPPDLRLPLQNFHLEDHFLEGQHSHQVLFSALSAVVYVDLHFVFEVEEAEAVGLAVLDVAAEDFAVWVDCEDRAFDLTAQEPRRGRRVVGYR